MIETSITFKTYAEARAFMIGFDLAYFREIAAGFDPEGIATILVDLKSSRAEAHFDKIMEEYRYAKDLTEKDGRFSTDMDIQRGQE